MRLLDLFCGAGGAAMGYHRAGFDEIVGIDINPQPRYPFTFIQADALEPPVRLGAFDLIHASPPCQAYSVATLDNSKHPDLIELARLLIQHKPYVIENVVGAPLDGYLRLCGSMFGLQIQRHRYFEMSFPAWSPPCSHNWKDGRPWTVTGDGGGHKSAHSWKPGPLEQWQELMGMPWTQRKAEISEAIPPAYTEYIGEQFLAQR